MAQELKMPKWESHFQFLESTVHFLADRFPPLGTQPADPEIVGTETKILGVGY